MNYYSNINKTILVLMLLFSFVVLAQEKRNGITYQAVIINNNEEGLPGVNNSNVSFIDKEVCIKSTIIDNNGSVEYEEVLKTFTDKQGMINIIIGTGEPVNSSSWDKISWSAASKVLKVDIDLTAQCKSFQNLSSQELTSVPFALYAPSSNIPGPKGNDGANGLSAYELYALNNIDPDLSEVAWLASLKGDDGLPGVKGESGEFPYNWPDGTSLGDVLTWIWDGKVWVGTILQSDDNLIVITSSPGTNSQMVCEKSAIDQISYAINIDTNGLTVTGLPKGIEYVLENDILNIRGTIESNVNSQTTFTYIISVPNGSTTIRTKGTIKVNPLASIELKTGSLRQNSCINSPIESITFKINGPAPNAKVTGLPNGVISNLSGGVLTISGTPTGPIVSGSVYNFVIETNSLSCEAASISGELILTDCSSCFPSVNAGIDKTICLGDSYPIQNSSAANFSSLVWTTSGSGTFNDSTIANATYFPTNADFARGSVILTLTGTNNSCIETQQVVDTMTLNIIDCSTGNINATLVNNLECYLFAYNAKFGATIRTNDIQKIATAGLCYNNTGGPTVSDVTVFENNTGTGWWANSTPKFELELLGLPINKPLFIRAYVITITNDIIYGDQIEVQANDPNLNHIFNFTETGNFDINNFPVTTTSEITFVNVKSLNGFTWTSPGPMSRNIVTVNFPVLTTINGDFRIQNEFSIRKINAAALNSLRNTYISNTSVNEVLFSSLQSIGNTNIQNNINLKELYFPHLKNVTSSISINGNSSITTINWPDLKLVEQSFTIDNNLSLQTVRLNELEKIYHNLQVSNNIELISLFAPKLFSVGNNLFNGRTINIYSNNKLATLDFNSLKKVYNGLYIYANRSLDIGQLPCAIYVYKNDGFDCSPESVNVFGNQNNTYCFQDNSLRQVSFVATQPIVLITNESAKSGGIITSNSFVKVKSKGVCWSINPNPTISDAFSENGNFNDNYDSYIYNLLPNTIYYVRAYIEDCNGYYYGNELSFTSAP